MNHSDTFLRSHGCSPVRPPDAIIVRRFVRDLVRYHFTKALVAPIYYVSQIAREFFPSAKLFSVPWIHPSSSSDRLDFIPVETNLLYLPREIRSVALPANYLREARTRACMPHLATKWRGFAVNWRGNLYRSGTVGSRNSRELPCRFSRLQMLLSLSYDIVPLNDWIMSRESDPIIPRFDQIHVARVRHPVATITYDTLPYPPLAYRSTSENRDLTLGCGIPRHFAKTSISGTGPWHGPSSIHFLFLSTSFPRFILSIAAFLCPRRTKETRVSSERAFSSHMHVRTHARTYVRTHSHVRRVTHRTAFAANNYVGDFSVACTLFLSLSLSFSLTRSFSLARVYVSSTRSFFSIRPSSRFSF